MKNLIFTSGIAIILACSSLVATAAPKTVTLAIPSMDCPVCPLTVKKALSQVSGVIHTNVNFDQRQEIVRFDDARTNVGALTESTKNAGYPSTVLGDAN